VQTARQDDWTATLGEEMRKLKTTLIIALAVAVFAQVANAKECTQMDAYAAETVADYLDSWKNVSRAFRAFGHCDDGGIAEGFDEAISLLWANQWQNMPEMLKYTEESKGFRAFIYKRIWSETVPAGRWKKILKKAQNECPKSGKEFCAEIIQAGKATPISSELINWADVVFCMEKSHRNKLTSKFKSEFNTKRLVVLDIPDNYKYMDPELVRLLKAKVPRYIRI
jgi:predicted protein tyrosine phosphatase